jgi:hypothetical protein
MLFEMIPRLIVHRNKHISLEIAEEVSRLPTIHGDLYRFALLARLSFRCEIVKSRFPAVHDGNGDVVILGDLGELGYVYGIAGEVHCIRSTVGRNSKAFGAQEETDALVARPVISRCTGDVERGACDLDIPLLPVAESEHTGSRRKVLRSLVSCEDMATIEYTASEVIQIIEVVFVTEKNGVDVRKLVQLQGRIVVDFEDRVHAIVMLGPCRREERMGEECDTVDVEDGGGGGGANVCD